MKGSAKADPVLLAIPNENYPRELMQLFFHRHRHVERRWVGAIRQRQGDSDLQRKHGQGGLARALTGWNLPARIRPVMALALSGCAIPSDAASAAKACTAWSSPMEPWTATYRANDDGATSRGRARFRCENAARVPRFGCPFANVPAFTTPNPTPAQLAAAAI